MQERDTNRENRSEEDPSAFDYDDEEPEEESEPESAPRGGLKLLTVIQISVSVVILVAALILRMFGGDLFQTVRAWYVSAVDDSIIAEEQIDQARRTVVELWGNIAAAGPKSAVSSESGATASAKGTASAQNSNSAAGAQSGTSQAGSAVGASQAGSAAGTSQAPASAGKPG